MQRIFPARVGKNDVVSLYFHQELATTINEQRMQPVSVTVEVFDNNDVGECACYAARKKCR